MSGPVPNRSEDLARPRSRKGGDQVPVTPGLLMPVEWPPPKEDWEEFATDLYEACQISGQASFYQQSDIAMLRSLCDDLSYVKRQGNRRSGQMLQTIYSTLTGLMVTEGDRRRLRIELSAPETADASQAEVVLAEYQAGLRLVTESK